MHSHRSAISFAALMKVLKSQRRLAAAWKAAAPLTGFIIRASSMRQKHVPALCTEEEERGDQRNLYTTKDKRDRTRATRSTRITGRFGS
jgi:hypothetical protein